MAETSGKSAFKSEGMNRGNLFFFPPEDVIAKPENNKGRAFPHTQQDIIERAISIINNGQLEPVTIRKVGDRPELVFGFLRHAGILLKNQWAVQPETMPAWVKDFILPDRTIEVTKIACVKRDMNDEEAILAALAENRDRKDSNHIDVAFGHRRLRENHGWTNEQIAKNQHLSSTWVGKLQKLLALNRAEQQLVANGELPIDIAERLADLPFDERQAHIKQHLQPVKAPEGRLPFPATGEGAVGQNGEAATVTLDSKGLRETLRQSATEKGNKAVSRTLSEVRKLVQGLAVVPDGEEPADPDLVPVAKSILEVFAGTKGQQALVNAITRYGEAKVEEYKAGLKEKAGIVRGKPETAKAKAAR